MYCFKPTRLCVCLFFVCIASGKKVGSKCKITGTCQNVGTCPGDVIGKCCGGLDCCDCQKPNTTCGTTQNGACSPIGSCSDSVLTGRCCEGYECCSCLGEQATCGLLNDGVCVPVGDCTGSEIEGMCCPGFSCCQSTCWAESEDCSEIATCVMNGYCLVPDDTGEQCCTGFTCCIEPGV